MNSLSLLHLDPDDLIMNIMGIEVQIQGSNDIIGPRQHVHAPGLHLADGQLMIRPWWMSWHSWEWYRCIRLKQLYRDLRRQEETCKYASPSLLATHHPHIHHPSQHHDVLRDWVKLLEGFEIIVQ